MLESINLAKHNSDLGAGDPGDRNPLDQGFGAIPTDSGYRKARKDP
jgi:hypothetical protein